jgi:kynurenine formamidase
VIRHVDLSHVVEHGMTTYPGLPGPLICDFLSREDSRGRYADGVEFQIGKIELVANTGTYVDAPSHRWADGVDLAGLPLDRLAGREIVVVDAVGETSVGVDAVAGLDVTGKAVLVRTGWDRHWGTETYLSRNPFLTEELALSLVERGAAIVGIDSLNIDTLDDLRRPVHSVLLREGIPIVEHMTGLTDVPATGARLFAVPVKVRGMGTFPVRAFATVEG